MTRQVITFTTPGVHVERPALSVQWATLVNDCLGKIVKERPKHFAALATLPLNDPDASVIELERAMKQHGLPGAMLFSNVNGVPLADPRYFPLYQKADELGAVLHIHPMYPLGVEAMKEYWLMPLVGFLMDTTLAASHLVFAGVPERFPRIKWVLGHLGGAIPYLAERLDRGYEAFADCRKNISKPPTDYLRHFYYDTVNFDPNALMLAVQFAGADHILAGSDYPHQIGSIPKMKTALDSLPLPADQKAGILGGNTPGASTGCSRRHSHMRTLLRATLTAAALVAAPLTASATWSVIALDAQTGQVIIASATCVRQAGFPQRQPNGSRDLMDVQAVIVPGLGVAACQAGVDNTRRNQMLVYNEIKKGTPPEKIIELLKQDPDVQRRQFGIVMMPQGDTITRAITAPASAAAATRSRRCSGAARSATSTTRCRATRCSATRW